MTTTGSVAASCSSQYRRVTVMPRAFRALFPFSLSPSLERARADGGARWCARRGDIIGDIVGVGVARLARTSVARLGERERGDASVRHRRGSSATIARTRRRRTRTASRMNSRSRCLTPSSTPSSVRATRRRGRCEVSMARGAERKTRRGTDARNSETPSRGRC